MEKWSFICSYNCFVTSAWISKLSTWACLLLDLFGRVISSTNYFKMVLGLRARIFKCPLFFISIQPLHSLPHCLAQLPIYKSWSSTSPRMRFIWAHFMILNKYSIYFSDSVILFIVCNLTKLQTYHIKMLLKFKTKLICPFHFLINPNIFKQKLLPKQFFRDKMGSK